MLFLRKKSLFITSLAVIICICFNLFSACSYLNGGVFGITFLAVGEADCEIIKFPDGKVLVIDVAEQSKTNYKNIKKELSSVKEIEWLVLTHTDSDHIGNAADLASDFKIKNALIPCVENPDLFPEFKEAETKIRENGASVITSRYGLSFSGDGYYFCVLSPEPPEIDGFYSKLNETDKPTSDVINNCSCVIYLEYKGLRAVFTGDAGNLAEREIVNNVKAGVYNLYYGEDRINLEDIDFLKVSHHGGNDATSGDFIQLLRPKNAVISVGGGNIYNHPSDEVLLRLQLSNPEVNVLRTDTVGSVRVNIGDNGTYIMTMGDDI